MADVVKFPAPKPAAGHPLLAVPGLAARCRSIVSCLPLDMRAGALVAAAALEIAERASVAEARELCLAQVRFVLQALDHIEQTGGSDA
jgi:hypothetical protein